MDRYDLALLRQCSAKFAFLKLRQEDRAGDLYRAGYLERTLRVFRATRESTEHRWAYRLSETGRAAIAAEKEKTA